MQLKLTFIIWFFFLLCNCFVSSFAQSTLIKKISVTVTDAITTNPVAGAEVTYRGLTRRVKTTDDKGKVDFEIPLISKILNATIEVKDHQHPPFKSSITLYDNQEFYPVSIQLRSVNKLVSVAVSAEGGALSNAKVTLKNAQMEGDITGQTNENGVATFDIGFIDPRTVKVIVEKNGYIAATISFDMSSRSDQYPVSATLKKDESIKWLNAEVVADDDGSPVMGAIVSAMGKTLKDTYSNTTNQQGEAKVALQSGGDMDISARHPDYWTETQSTTINYYGDAKEFSAKFRLKRKGQNPNKRKLIVWVYAKGKNGELLPVYGAGVQMGKEFANSSITDRSGKATIDVKMQMGEDIVVTATAENFEKMTKIYVIGNDNWTNPGKVDELIFILDKPKTNTLNLSVEILDAITNKPIPGATAVVKDYSGNQVSIAADPANTKGGVGVELKINGSELNKSLRVIANATDYEEKWSDLPQEYKQLSQDQRYFTVFLKKKKTAPGADKKFGPFPVTLSGWTSTNLRFKRGGTFRTEVTGKMTSLDDKGQPQEMSPDGSGYWKWFKLKGQIGKNQAELGSIGAGYADEDGTLELGAPRVSHFFPDDAKGTSGSWMVYVYTKDANEGDQPAVSTNSNNSEAKVHLAYLKELLKGRQMGSTSPTDLAEAVRSIVIIHKLENVKKYYNFEAGIMNIKRYHEYFNFRLGSPSETEIKQYQSFLSSIISELESQLK